MEEKVFFEEIKDECREIISKTVNSFLKEKAYNSKDTDFMINYLNDTILNQIKRISDNFKYLINIVLLKDKCSGFTIDSSLYYDTDTDGAILEEFLFNDIVCIVNLYCLAI
jgi:hypothetical protein